jgi:hypothetical protein
MELREKIRYPVRALAVFSWEGVRGDRLQGEGLTRDISLSGAFLFSPICPPVKETIQVEILLPPLNGSASRVQIRAEACIVRVEHCLLESGQSGFAISTAGFDLVTSSIEDVEASASFTEELERTREALDD